MIDAASGALQRTRALEVHPSDNATVLSMLRSFTTAAPHLETLRIYRQFKTQEENLPDMFVDGNAPKLASLTLHGFAMGPSISNLLRNSLTYLMIHLVPDPGDFSSHSCDTLLDAFGAMQSLETVILANFFRSRGNVHEHAGTHAMVSLPRVQRFALMGIRPGDCAHVMKHLDLPANAQMRFNLPGSPGDRDASAAGETQSLDSFIFSYLRREHLSSITIELFAHGDEDDDESDDGEGGGLAYGIYDGVEVVFTGKYLDTAAQLEDECEREDEPDDLRIQITHQVPAHVAADATDALTARWLDALRAHVVWESVEELYLSAPWPTAAWRLLWPRMAALQDLVACGASGLALFLFLQAHAAQPARPLLPALRSVGFNDVDFKAASRRGGKGLPGNFLLEWFRGRAAIDLPLEHVGLDGCVTNRGRHVCHEYSAADLIP